MGFVIGMATEKLW